MLKIWKEFTLLLIVVALLVAGAAYFPTAKQEVVVPSNVMPLHYLYTFHIAEVTTSDGEPYTVYARIGIKFPDGDGDYLSFQTPFHQSLLMTSTQYLSTDVLSQEFMEDVVKKFNERNSGVKMELDKLEMMASPSSKWVEVLHAG